MRSQGQCRHVTTIGNAVTLNRCLSLSIRCERVTRTAEMIRSMSTGRKNEGVRGELVWKEKEFRGTVSAQSVAEG